MIACFHIIKDTANLVWQKRPLASKQNARWRKTIQKLAVDGFQRLKVCHLKPASGLTPAHMLYETCKRRDNVLFLQSL